jgi:hypothetical protein
LAHETGVELALSDDYGRWRFPHGRCLDSLEFYEREAGIRTLGVNRWGTVAAGKLVVDRDHTRRPPPGRRPQHQGQPSQAACTRANARPQQQDFIWQIRLRFPCLKVAAGTQFFLINKRR